MKNCYNIYVVVPEPSLSPSLGNSMWSLVIDVSGTLKKIMLNPVGYGLIGSESDDYFKTQLDGQKSIVQYNSF